VGCYIWYGKEGPGQNNNNNNNNNESFTRPITISQDERQTGNKLAACRYIEWRIVGTKSIHVVGTTISLADTGCVWWMATDL